MKNHAAYIFVLLVLFTIGTVDAQSLKAEHKVFLLGDAGKPKNAPENFELLKKHLDAADEQSTLLFLGDNVYHDGLPDKGHKDREVQEKKLVEQLKLAKNFKGRVIMIPGNHDWDNAGKEGWDRVRNQNKFVKKYFDSKEVYFPKNGEPGPEEIQLDEDLFLIIFDMQWMLHPWEKPLIDDILVEHEISDVLIDLNRMLENHRNDHVILAAHHPMYSYGSHGGKFPFKQHIFPLTAVNPKLYIPLPVVGSIYPGYRATAGSLQDIPHPKYKRIRNAIEKMISQYPNLVYVCGHEHSLQHIKKDDRNYIVSGSGSKTSYIKQGGKYLAFGASKNGFGILQYRDMQEPTLEFLSADSEHKEGISLYKTGLYKVDLKPKGEGYPNYHFKDTVKRVAASDQYAAGGWKRAFMGENYRSVWATEVSAPIFNISDEHGGLDIVKKGGGLQTNSLRLQANSGKQYVLRSLQKYPERALPSVMHGTIAVNVVQDQMSASNPYGAFVVPTLADAVGIYHTNPKLVYVPDDGALGKYRESVANTLMLYEERPAKDWSEADFFGNSDDLVNSEEVLEEIHDDNDNFVDQTWTLRNRMFDLVISDWDRHEDQWRWASFDEGKGKKYRPIPRDRDQTFYLNEGILPKIASRKWIMPRIEGFNPDVRWAPGLSFNARHFDRWFLTNLEKEDWKKMAEEVESKLTDEVIEDAIGQWPPEIYALEGKETIEILKARRDNLSEYSLDLYDALAKVVEVVCSDKKELVTIQNLSKDELRVTVQKISKGGDIRQTTYNRKFLASETKEIRIYGMDGKDRFEIKGSTINKIKVRIVGGKGKDEVHDLMTAGVAKNVRLYDKKTTVIATDRQSYRSRLSNRKGINKYDRYWFAYDRLIPLVYGSVNVDDNLFLGAGFMWLKQGWRKDPYKARHLFLASKATATEAFTLQYTADFTDVFGKWNIKTDLHVLNPWVQNYFGLGNDSEYVLSNGIDFYRTRIEKNNYKLEVNRKLGNKGLLAVGTHYQAIKVNRTTGRYLETDIAGLPNAAGLFNNYRNYLGGYGKLTFDTRDEKLFPTRGLLWDSEYAAYQGMNDNTTHYSRMSSSLALFYSFPYPARVILGSQTGWSHNIGSLDPDEFYNYNILGGRTNLRGYRRTRFYGESIFYQNVDVRFVLKDFKSILFPGKMGVHGFYDVGRVWLTGEDSNTWHRSAGAGIWLAPLSKIGLSLSYAFSPEEDLLSFDFGFFF